MTRDWKAVAEERANAAVHHTHFVTVIQKALENAYDLGRRDERRELKEELQKYAADSVVAQLIKDKLESEEYS